MRKQIKEILLKQMQLLQEASEQCSIAELLKMSEMLSKALNSLSVDFYETL